jgi:hypothetical protein
MTNLKPTDAVLNPPLRWIPEVGDVTTQFLRSKTKDGNGPSYDELTVGDNSVLQEARRILGRCLPPTAPDGRETGLVVGYVQSGKTMSFETVISLARDNGYGLVIVFAGTKTNLREQSEDRLTKDLGIDDGQNWCHFSNPTDTMGSQIQDRLRVWRGNPVKKRAVLITVLKHQDHLENLAIVLSSLKLSELAVLVIDDESDQASLNTKAGDIKKSKEKPDARSSIFNKICIVRDRIPHHSFLQYTATPQANLLLTQTNILNPNFAEIVTPGDAYTGGKSFFRDNSNLVIEIHPSEVPSKDNQVHSVPKSLLSALRYFFLVCAYHSIHSDGRIDRNRSMMIHPSMATTSHKLYFGWVDKAVKSIEKIVEEARHSSPATIESMFKKEYESLKETYPDLNTLPELISAMSSEVLGELRCVQVNGSKDAEKKVKWKLTPYWILVGGAKLDRGYTVEGLAITYMPRPLGSSPAADTLQQRARFFGYKKAYLGLCRVFLQKEVRDAFKAYVEHEENVRAILVKTRGLPLSEWRRDFILSASLKATRPNVVELNSRRIKAKGWLVPQALNRDSVAVKYNQNLVSDVVSLWRSKFPCVNAADIERFKGKRDKSPNYVFTGIPLYEVLNSILLNFKVHDPFDAELHSAILISLAEVLQTWGNVPIDVYLINNLKSQYRSRTDGRGFTKGNLNAPINQYFSNSADAINDKSFMSNNNISLQLRSFDLGAHERQATLADLKNVAWFALHIPIDFEKHVHVEKV